MPDFVNPFIGLTPDRPMTTAELTRALRLDLAAELEAIHLYEAQADATDDPLAAQVLRDIANEERVHAGEFQRLLALLLPDEEALLQEGAAEVDEMAAGSGDSTEAEAETAPEVGTTAAGATAAEVPTIGSLR